jgi:hypothetical protein
MAEGKLGNLVHVLQQHTNEQKIIWEKTVNEDVFQVAFSNYIVHIGYRLFDTQIEYFIRILDDYNAIVEEATDIDLQSELGGARQSYKTMEALYGSARSQAMGVDKAIDSILSNLENDK